MKQTITQRTCILGKMQLNSPIANLLVNMSVAGMCRMCPNKWFQLVVDSKPIVFQV